ncbi:MAG: mismatch-specific DNA-glycosylase [Chloroflexota bacterium]|nr:mismatch-specific DNA-glycosylase [Chloroflexota bacterium]
MAVLPDVLEPGLKVVFCGTAAGTQSAQAGAYYAGRGNQFWKVLLQVGLAPRQFAPHEFHTLPKYGVGFTDLAKTYSGPDDGLLSSDFDAAGLLSKIRRFAPQALAFNGKRAAKGFYDRKRVDYGRQPNPIRSTVVFVLPSTSGAARRYWDESYWRELADFLDTTRRAAGPRMKTQRLMYE